MERERVSAREKERKREEGRRFWVSICSLKSVQSVKKWSDIWPRDKRKQKVCLQIQNGQREWMFFRWRSVTSTNKALNFVVIFCQKIWQRSCLFVPLLTDTYKDTHTQTHTHTLVNIESKPTGDICWPILTCIIHTFGHVYVIILLSLSLSLSHTHTRTHTHAHTHTQA